MSGELAGQSAIVTGAAQGLGLAIACELARQGATVCLADLQHDIASEEARKLDELSLVAYGAHLDVSDTDEVDRLMAGIVERHGRLDILVNSAGVGQRLARVRDLTDAEWMRSLAINLNGTFACCRAAIRHMEPRETGSIVNVASINGQQPAPLAAAYNAAKAAVISLTRTLALEEAAYGIRVNAVSPGPVYTAFNRSVMSQRAEALGIDEDEMIGRIRSAVPLGRWGEPQDIAQGVAFLCGPRASWITGETLRISGGLEGVGSAPARSAEPGETRD